MNDLVAVRHMKLMKLNVLSIKTTAVHVVPPCERQLTFPEHHLNEVMHTATDGRNGLFAPTAIRGDSWRFAN